MPTLRHLVSIYPAIYVMLVLVASAHPLQGQTATLSDTSPSFGDVVWGSSSAAVTVTLRNSSTRTALAITNIAASGDFSQTNTCGASLAARGSCAIKLVFSPSATGTRIGTLTVTDNAIPNTQAASLTGNGVAPLSISPSSRTFGNVVVGSPSAAKTFTLTNLGATALALTAITPSAGFTQTNNCASSLAGKASCTINASFAPAATGVANGTITVDYNGLGSPAVGSMTGTGVAPVTLSPASTSFGNVAVGSTSAAKAFTVTNLGSSAWALTITPSAGFTQTNTCGSSLAGKASCTINTTFTPTAVGTGIGTVTVSYDGIGSPIVGSMTGTGVVPVTLSPASASFGNVVAESTSASKAFTVTNLGASALALTITPSAGFTQTNTCGASLAGKASCTINAAFTPTAVGAATGTVTVSYNGIGSPTVGSMTGTGVAPVTLSPASTSFGNVAVGSTSAAKAFTVTNLGASALALTITPSAGFTQTNTCGSSLAGKASCTINTMFTPTTIGAGSGTVTVSYNGIGSPIAGSMTGTGVAPVTLSPASASFGNVAVGSTSAAKSFTVTNLGASALALTITPSAGFTQTNTCGSSLAGKASCTINAVFTPTAAGASSGTVTVSYDGVGSPIVGSVTGTGVVPITLSPAARSFGNVGVGSTSATTTFTVTNRGTAAMALAIVPSAGFTQTNTCKISLAAGASCTINAAFVPTALGDVNGTISVSYNGFGSPLSAAMTGTGINPVTLNPISRDFGSVAAGTASATKTITVTNNGTAKLTMALAASAGFTETDNCRSLNGGASCTINAVFSPLAIGSATGAITVAYNGFGSPVSAPLTGTGIAPVTISPAFLAFSTTQNVDSATAASTVTIRNNATKPLIIQSIVANPTDYVQTNNCGSVLAAGASCIVSLVFTPHVEGSILGTLIVTDSALGSPQTVPMSGAGVPFIRSIAITPASAEIPKGKQLQLSAVATYSNGTTSDVTAVAGWSSSNPAAVSIVATTALATGAAEGNAVIAATVAGTSVTGTSTVTTTPPALTELSLSPGQRECCGRRNPRLHRDGNICRRHIRTRACRLADFLFREHERGDDQCRRTCFRLGWRNHQHHGGLWERYVPGGGL